VVEFETTKIDARDLYEAYADELVCGIGDILVETNNLLVDLGTVPSRLAPKHEEDGFARSLRLGLRGGIIGEPAVLRRLNLARLCIRGTHRHEKSECR
jgi:hypothetical protein